ncbi:ADP-ribosylation factor-like protein [Dirofilaria immitis]
MGLLSQISIALGVTRRQVNILMIGLDNSGKSTIINQMKAQNDQVTQVVSSIGCTVEKFIFNNTTFLIYDMSGQGKYRNLWENYYSEVDGVVFVIDSNDRLRLAVVRDEFRLLLDHKEFVRKKIPLLVFANKMDEKGAMITSEISLYIGLNLINNRNWHISAICAITGEGLNDGFQWLLENIRAYMESKNN